MGSRRLDISSLLCTDDSPTTVKSSLPANSSHSPPGPVFEPVILGPHLRNNNLHVQRDRDHDVVPLSLQPTPVKIRRTPSPPQPSTLDSRELEYSRTLPPVHAQYPRQRQPLYHPQSVAQHRPSSSHSHTQSWPNDYDDSEVEYPRSLQPHPHDQYPRQHQVDTVHHRQPSSSASVEQQYARPSSSHSQALSHSSHSHSHSPSAPYFYTPAQVQASTSMSVSPHHSPTTLLGPGHNGPSPNAYLPRPRPASAHAHSPGSHSLYAAPALPQSPSYYPPPLSPTLSRPRTSPQSQYRPSLSPTIPVHSNGQRPSLSPTFSTHPHSRPHPQQHSPPHPSTMQQQPAKSTTYVGLEALVQAASEERRRLSDGNASVAASNASRVGDEPRRVSDGHVKVQDLPASNGERVMEKRPVQEDVRMDVDVAVTEREQPPQKRRRSSASASGSEQRISHSIPAKESSVSVASAHGDEGRATPAPLPPSKIEKVEVVVKPKEVPSVGPLSEGEKHEKPKAKPRPRPRPPKEKSAEGEASTTTAQKPRKKKPPPPPHAAAEGPPQEQQDDPHEWLLEHYAEASPPPAPEPTISHAPDPHMEVDVEDELLSLVDDRPTSHGHVHAPKVKEESQARPPKPFTHPTASTSATERGSMPPPASTSVKVPKKSAAGAAVGVGAGKKKAAVAVSKSAPKPKVSAKPRAKVVPKVKDDGKGSKASPAAVSVPAAARKSASASAAARSRSASAMPSQDGGEKDGMHMDVDDEGEDEEDAKEDDKLYCVCKTRYDEDRVMIACDRCDEWYHTQCVNMPDLEIDLVDQFICPPCVESNPHLALRTTYKKRCLNGLRQPDPSSPSACHKPARGAFSKYCSDDCGVRYMEARIGAWEKKGGKREKLWESVRDAEKREGVVVCVDPDASGAVKPEPDSVKMEVDTEGAFDASVKAKKVKLDREVARLEAHLEKVVREREDRKKEMEIVRWRERLTDLATERAERVDECGWDQRLCFGDEEWEEFGAGVLESYEDEGPEHSSAEDGEWWCRGHRKCERHAGWQKLRAAEVAFERETKESAVGKLTTQERELRRRIEDIITPQARPAVPLKMPLTSAHSTNGHANVHVEEAAKKGKKRKQI
ncbi:hypothetical protein PLICRDRAFT_394830 [Plicaturopsis crispa FD-325 SS-3]|nr:hypothetical protein PLICRDRAFT_394830 [Plicaturopsis crispa FD-325 SS-3]